MNEKIDLTKILKDCPKGTKFYSSVYGTVMVNIDDNNLDYPIMLHPYKDNRLTAITCRLNKYGEIYEQFDGECVLFPSKEQRDWSKFKPKNPKFDPNTLQPFDKILGRGDVESSWQYQRTWCCATFSHINNDVMYPIKTTGDSYKYAVPYNDDTKHLVGTTDEAPEYYRYWEA